MGVLEESKERFFETAGESIVLPMTSQAFPMRRENDHLCSKAEGRLESAEAEFN